MKTIAVSIDEPTLQALDRVASEPGGTGKQGRASTNRSKIVRRALREYIERREKATREEKERSIFAANREALAREAAALVADQAKP
jgi:metal-responsive CopG/Arc/MetJ family transcriptional regulator